MGLLDAAVFAVPASPAEAMELQRRLAGRVVTQSLRRVSELRLVAGLDVAYDRRTNRCHAAIVVLDRETGAVTEEAVHSEDARFPYMPGLLSFREIPPLLVAFERLSGGVDLLVADAHGLAHPRRFGLACHIGVLAGIPTIGCAKSLLTGTHGPLGVERGSEAALRDARSGEVLGAVLRTRAGVSPVYVSVGHGISLADAVGLVLELAPRYRLTEPVRRAHALSLRTLRAEAAARFQTPPAPDAP